MNSRPPVPSSSHARRPQIFCSSRGIRLIDLLRRGASAPGTGRREAETIVHMDPPRHGAVRALLSKVFTPRRVSALEPWMRSLFRERLAGLPPGEPIDLVAEIAAPIPAIAIARVLGVPEEGWREFRAAADALITTLRAPPCVMWVRAVLPARNRPVASMTTSGRSLPATSPTGSWW